MALRLAILGATLAINFLLAMLLVRQKEPQPRHQAEILAESISTDSQTFTNWAASRGNFRWSQLESGDYLEYISRLRKFGVPEQVIADIIIADISKTYRPKFAAVRPQLPTVNPNFWESHKRWLNASVTRDQIKQLKILQAERRNLIKTLLGDRAFDGLPDWRQSMFSYIPEYKREQVIATYEKYQEDYAAVHEEADGYFDSGHANKLQSLQAKFESDLSQALTPEEMENYELRHSDIANNLRHSLRAFEPTKEEFRAIYRHKKSGAPLSESLSQERLELYEAVINPNYRSLMSEGVTGESLVKVVRLRNESESAVQRVNADNSLTSEQQSEALKKIGAQAQAALSEIVGEPLARKYLPVSGWLTPTPPIERPGNP